MNGISPTAGVFRLNAAWADQARTFERLSTGLAINRASDNPAGLIASERLGARQAELESRIDSFERSVAFMNIEEAELEAADPGVGSAEARAAIGAEQRGLEAERRAAETEYINTAAARSSIRDTDYAEAVSTLTSQQIRFKAAAMALKITNDARKGAADLLIGGVVDRAA